MTESARLAAGAARDYPEAAKLAQPHGITLRQFSPHHYGLVAPYWRWDARPTTYNLMLMYDHNGEAPRLDTIQSRNPKWTLLQLIKTAVALLNKAAEIEIYDGAKDIPAVDELDVPTHNPDLVPFDPPYKTVGKSVPQQMKEAVAEMDLALFNAVPEEKAELVALPPTPPVQHPSPDQRFAIDTIINAPDSSALILTGMAGSGKTFVINHLQTLVPDMVVTAMTGTAAQLLRGRTLHSYAGLNWRDNSLIHKDEIDQRVKDCGLLVIDEAPMASVQCVQNLYNRFHFCGRIPKVVFSGDWCQLGAFTAPGGAQNDSLLTVMHAWTSVPVLKLTTQHRQAEDPEFLACLNDIRIGELTPRVRAMFDRRTVDKIPEDALRAEARRDTAAEINQERLAQLPGRMESFFWSQQYPMVNGRQRPPDPDEQPPEFRARFPKRLDLKIDALIIMLNNTLDWQNGTTGRVTGFGPGMIYVELQNGRKVSILKASEDIIDANGKVMCTVTQFPMQLAYAMTIHKFQGQTVKGKLGVNLSNHFAAGMTYVACSRVCRESDLFLTGYTRKLMVDYRALAYA